MNARLTPAYYWFAIFASTFIAFQGVQDYIRPNYRGEYATVAYLLGIAPNFFPSIGIPALMVILIPELNSKNKPNKWLNDSKHITANIVSQIGLISWEFLQLTTTKGRFDWNDVLWTLIGAVVFQVIWTVTPLRYKM